MTRVCKIILVCEGWRDSAFARGFLAAAAVDARAVDPKVNPGGRCLLLPARNIETWLYWLIANEEGVPVDMNETTNYKTDGPPSGCSRVGNEDCRPAGEHLHTLNHAAMPTGCPPALGQSLGRLREFLGGVRR